MYFLGEAGFKLLAKIQNSLSSEFTNSTNQNSFLQRKLHFDEVLTELKKEPHGNMSFPTSSLWFPSQGFQVPKQVENLQICSFHSKSE